MPKSDQPNERTSVRERGAKSGDAAMGADRNASDLSADQVAAGAAAGSMTPARTLSKQLEQ
jgi:hypothetical protein